MKKLILVRHAKSDWGHEGLKDVDRPLTERGYQDAYIMAEWFKKSLPMPDAIVSSDATRALSTALIFARALNINPNTVRIDEDLYESNLQKWLKVIATFDNKCNTVAIFGHNPVITTLANEINKDLFFDDMPTCAVVAVELSLSSWKDIADKKEGKLITYKFPKSFKQ